MRSVLFCLLIYFNFNNIILSQNPAYYAIDNHADIIKEDTFKNLNILVEKLIEPAKNDTDKVRAIFYWIAKNIKYDDRGLYRGQWDNYSIDENTAAATFAYRKGICRGFAYLMKMMLDLAEIDNELIYGNGKGEGSGRDTIRSNHVWNAVKLDNKWQLMDVTRANIDWSKTIKVKDYFFLTDPIEFGLNHYPDSAKWLLYDNPLSYAEYEQLPVIGMNYYHLGFGKTIPKVDKFKDKVVIRVEMPSGLIPEVLIRNKDTGNEIVLHNCDITKDNQISIISVPIPEKGMFEIELNVLIDKLPYAKYFSIITIDFDN
jgi:hypothetical protein